MGLLRSSERADRQRKGPDRHARIEPKGTDGDTKWSYARSDGWFGYPYSIRLGSEIVALAKTRRHAELICNGRQEWRKHAADKQRHAFDMRRQQDRIRTLSEQNRLLLCTLTRITDIMSRSRPTEIEIARQEARKLMRRLKHMETLGRTGYISR